MTQAGNQINLATAPRLKDFKKNVSIVIGDSSTQIFKVGYTADGSYWIKDLLRLNQTDLPCGVAAYQCDTSNHGERLAEVKYSAFTSGSLKLSHHPDGRAQFSGTGIISGFDKDTGKPKGASVQSFCLNTTNDGGAMFSFLLWGLEHFKRPGISTDCQLQLDPRRTHSSYQGRNLNAIAIEGFYILKSSLPLGYIFTEKLLYRTPVGGEALLSLVPSPPNTPGVLGFVASPACRGFAKEDFGFTLSGAPGVIYDEHYCDCLCAYYPYREAISQSPTLDLHV
jgi:hypothetical protein